MNKRLRATLSIAGVGALGAVGVAIAIDASSSPRPVQAGPGTTGAPMQVVSDAKLSWSAGPEEGFRCATFTSSALPGGQSATCVSAREIAEDGVIFWRRDDGYPMTVFGVLPSKATSNEIDFAGMRVAAKGPDRAFMVTNVPQTGDKLIRFVVDGTPRTIVVPGAEKMRPAPEDQP